MSVLICLYLIWRTGYCDTYAQTQEVKRLDILQDSRNDNKLLIKGQ